MGFQKWLQKNPFDEVVISEILGANTDLESGAEACDVEDELEEGDEEEEQQQQ